MSTALALNTLKYATGAASGLAISGSLIGGQKFGNPLDFLKGSIGFNKEQYYDQHGTTTGTFMGALGGTTDNFVSLGVTALATGNKKLLGFVKEMGLKTKNFRKIGLIAAPITMGWQAMQGISEIKDGDGDPVKDKLDLAGNGFNILMLGAALKKGNVKKSWALLRNTAKRLIK